jgi:hypothetical protein
MPGKSQKLILIIVSLVKWAVLSTLFLTVSAGLIVTFNTGWSWQNFAVVLQYGAVLAFVLGGLAFISDMRRPRVDTHRPGDIMAQYQHRIAIFDNNLYPFLVGTLTMGLLYLLSRVIFYFTA